MKPEAVASIHIDYGGKWWRRETRLFHT